MLNWMNFKGRFRDIDDNPFAFKNIKAISSIKELNDLWLRCSEILSIVNDLFTHDFEFVKPIIKTI